MSRGVPALALSSKLQGEAEEVGKVLTAIAMDASSWSFGALPLLPAPAREASARPALGSDGPNAGCSDSSKAAPCVGVRAALLVGGETTVTMRCAAGAAGVGGRNQHLALAMLVALRDAGLHLPRPAAGGGEDGEGARDVAILALGTDGSDGPTDAAGVLVPSARSHLQAAAAAGLDLSGFLRRYDAYSYFTLMDAVMRGAGAAIHTQDGIVLRPGGLVVTGATGTNVCDIVALLVLE